MASRHILLYLDGFDAEIAARFMQEGLLPVLRDIQTRRITFELEHGSAKYTGVAGRHFATGEPPEQSGHWSNIEFDPETYHFDQPHVPLTPFPARMNKKTVVLDPLHFELKPGGTVRGVVDWGAHDPGLPVQSEPAGLYQEIVDRFGAYPAKEYIYGHVWPNVERTADMATKMKLAVRRRTEIAEWLLADRLPDWDMAIISISELHSAVESLWHGLDDTHPLHQHPSSSGAEKGLRDVYSETDRLIGRLIDRFPDAEILAYAPHGMARNMSDAPSMCLVPELLYRHYTGRVGLAPPESWRVDGTADTSFDHFRHWESGIGAHLHVQPAPRRQWFRRKKALLPARPSDLSWLPTLAYRTAWPDMDAFTFPAYHDARIRVNLKGREGLGRVDPSRYGAVVEEVCALLRSCRDPRDGSPVEAEINLRRDPPLNRSNTDADIIIRFAKDYYAFDHDRLGRIGPVPCRRPGGHTGGRGFGFFVGTEPSPQPAHLGVFQTLEMTATARALFDGGADATPLAAALRSRRIAA